MNNPTLELVLSFVLIVGTMALTMWLCQDVLLPIANLIFGG